MSVYYAVVLQMSNYEYSADYEKIAAPKSAPFLLRTINDWLEERHEQPLGLLGNYAKEPQPGRNNELEEPDQFGGSCRPYIQIAAGGYATFLDNDDGEQRAFCEFVTRLPWRYPEVVALLITVDGDTTKVYQPEVDLAKCCIGSERLLQPQ